MTNDVNILSEKLEAITKAFDEHEKEHHEMSTRLVWYAVGSIGMILSVGIWVGTISNDVDHLNGDIADKVSKAELVAAIGTIEARIETQNQLLIRIEQNINRLHSQ